MNTRMENAMFKIAMLLVILIVVTSSCTIQASQRSRLIKSRLENDPTQVLSGHRHPRDDKDEEERPRKRSGLNVTVPEETATPANPNPSCHGHGRRGCGGSAHPNINDNSLVGLLSRGYEHVANQLAEQQGHRDAFQRNDGDRRRLIEILNEARAIVGDISDDEPDEEDPNDDEQDDAGSVDEPPLPQ
jgi:hypothetical protein